MDPMTPSQNISIVTTGLTEDNKQSKSEEIKQTFFKIQLPVMTKITYKPTINPFSKESYK